MRQKLLIILILVGGLTYGQDASYFLNAAKNEVESGNLDKAYTKIKEGQNSYPNDHDLMAYESRILLWKKEYASAASSIEKLFLSYPNDYEGFELKSTAYLWQEQWLELKRTSENALSIYRDDPSFQEKLLYALNGLNEHKKVRETYNQIEHKNARMDAINFDAKLSDHQRVGTSYRYSHFTNSFDPWQFARVNYHREGKNPWSIAGTYGNMFGLNGSMFEAQIYPKIDKHIHAYFSASYSNSIIFPRLRIGGEVTGKVGKMEIIAGTRWMNFRATNIDLFIHSLGLGTYFGNYYANYKANLTDSNGDMNNLTHTLFIRRFFDHRFHFVQLNLSEGTTPLQVNNLSEITRLQAMSAQLMYSRILFQDYLVNVGIGSQVEKYSSGDRNRIDASVSVSRIF